MKYRRWHVSSCDPAAVSAMRKSGLTPLVAELLCVRGLDMPEKAAAFLASGPEKLNDPSLLLDMDKAVARISLALQKGETIAVYGDYDVDGITSTCLMTDFLRSRGATVLSYIPDRLEEGYGLNCEALRTLSRQGVTLVVTVDCGVTAVEEAACAATLGMDLVITDHHECKESLPDAVAVVDPCRPDCPYPFKELAGVGVALKLALALTPEEDRPELLARYGDLAAIGTVADVMEMTGENRAIVTLGLQAIENGPLRPGLAALLQEAGLFGKPLTATSISYGLAPRINAAGRMGHANLAVELLLTPSRAKAEESASALCELNRLRQSTELSIYQDCIARIGPTLPPEQHVLVLADEGWHQGVVGIVASRLVEQYHCPVFIVCLQGEKGKGSCRSCSGVNLFDALTACEDTLLGFGGHAAAAGFTILRSQLPAFREKMNRYVGKLLGGAEPPSVLEVDSEITDLSLLSLANVDSLSLLEPFGAGNPRPVLSLTGVTVESASDVGGGRHLRLRLSKNGRRLDGIFFSVNTQEAALSPGDQIDVAFCPQINEYRGFRSVQLQLLDLRPTRARMEQERQLFAKLSSGAELTADEAADLIPTRAEFAAVWRYIHRRAADAPLEDTALHLSRSVAQLFGLRETFMRTMVCLEVMHEQGLIQVEHSAGRLLIRSTPVEGKIDLEASHLMRRLRRSAGHSSESR